MKVLVGKVSAGRGLGGKAKHYRVEVHPNAKSMRRAICANDRWLRKQQMGPVRSGYSDTQALARYFGSWWERRHACIGVVYFHRDTFGAGVVAHEMTHAALYSIMPRSCPFVFTQRMDERLAMAVHRLVRGFWRWYYRENIETD